MLGGFPRFGVFGEAMWEVAELEKTGRGQQVHCSAKFLRLLTRSNGAALSAWHVAAAGKARRAAAAGETQEAWVAQEEEEEEEEEEGLFKADAVRGGGGGGGGRFIQG